MLDEDSFTPSSDAPNQRATMQSLARLMSPKGYDLRAERLEHVWQMNLLGDPLMRIHHPQPLEFAPHSDQLQPGQAVSLTGVSPQAGRLSIELAQRRGQAGNGSRRSKMDWTSEAGRAEYAGRYAAANRLVLSSSTQQVGRQLCRRLVAARWARQRSLCGPTLSRGPVGLDGRLP